MGCVWGEGFFLPLCQANVGFNFPRGHPLSLIPSPDTGSTSNQRVRRRRLAQYFAHLLVLYFAWQAEKRCPKKITLYALNVEHCTCQTMYTIHSTHTEQSTGYCKTVQTAGMLDQYPMISENSMCTGPIEIWNLGFFFISSSLYAQCLSFLKMKDKHNFEIAYIVTIL